MLWPADLRMMYSLRSRASVTVTSAPRPMNTCLTIGSIGFTLSPSTSLSTGTSRQPSSTWPSVPIARSISRSHA